MAWRTSEYDHNGVMAFGRDDPALMLRFYSMFFGQNRI